MDIKYLIGLVVALGAALFYQTKKRNSAEGLLETFDTKNKLNKQNEIIAEKQGELSSEEAKRKAIEDASKQEQERIANETIKDLQDFLNRP